MDDEEAYKLYRALQNTVVSLGQVLAFINQRKFGSALHGLESVHTEIVYHLDTLRRQTDG